MHAQSSRLIPHGGGPENNSPLRPSRIALGILAAIGGVPAALAGPAVPSPSPSPQEVQFSASFLGANSNDYNLSQYERGNPVHPGNYLVDIYVNGYRIAREDVSFVTPATGGNAQPCLTRELLGVMGVNVEKLEAAGINLDECADIGALIPNATASFDGGLLRLDVSIPQLALSRNPRGYVDPKLWDDGVNAFTLGYSANFNHVDSSHSRNSDSAYLGLKLGLNLGGWRIRNQSGYRWDKVGGSHFQAINTYAQHDITSLKSQLTLGDYTTPGQIFDAMPYRGIQIATDPRMRPDSMNGFAPIVRGTAETNAKVEIWQNGYLIFETTVAPGAFEINDLYANGSGGDLEVIITEVDERKRSYKVPYSSVPQLLRPGVQNYSATLGQMRNTAATLGSMREGAAKMEAPKFLEATYHRGFNNWFTGYAGGQATDGGLYRSALIGVAFNTPVGAVSLDVTGSRTNFETKRDARTGYSARITYNKNIPSTQTDFALAAYRYSSEGYFSMADAVMNDGRLRSGELDNLQDSFGQKRSQFQLTVTQRLTDRLGSLYFSGSRNDYWSHGRPVDLTYQLGWSNRWGDATYSINANRSRLVGGNFDTGVYLNLSLPLGRATQRGVPPLLTVGTSRTGSSKGVQAGVSGVAGERSQFNYGVNATLNDEQTGGRIGSVSVNGGWRAPYATMAASLTHGSDSRAASFSATGGLVVHSGGMTFTPQLGNTIGIVKAKGAKGARLTSDAANLIDSRGYLITTNLMPYRMNNVMLDPKGSALDVELETSRVQVAPRSGAVVALDFGTKAGKAMLVRGAMENGEALPFGARVTDADGSEIGLVGQGGQVFVRSADGAQGDWIVSWGDGEKCKLDRPAAPAAMGKDVEVVRAMCRSYNQ